MAQFYMHIAKCNLNIYIYQLIEYLSKIYACGRVLASCTEYLMNKQNKVHKFKISATKSDILNLNPTYPYRINRALSTWSIYIYIYILGY